MEYCRDNDQRFPYLSTFGASGGFNYADIGQKYEFTGLSYTHYATTAVTWEIATKHDIGIDFSLWDDKFTGTIDYFHEQRDGIYGARNGEGAVGRAGRDYVRGFDHRREVISGFMPHLRHIGTEKHV